MIVGTITYCSVSNLVYLNLLDYGSASLHEVRITPCPEAAARRPCILRKGTNVTIEMDFTPSNFFYHVLLKKI